MNKESVEGHWKYTEGIILRTLDMKPDERTLELMRYLYCQALVHGYKHGKEDS